MAEENLITRVTQLENENTRLKTNMQIFELVLSKMCITLGVNLNELVVEAREQLEEDDVPTSEEELEKELEGGDDDDELMHFVYATNAKPGNKGTHLRMWYAGAWHIDDDDDLELWSASKKKAYRVPDDDMPALIKHLKKNMPKGYPYLGDIEA